MRWMLSVLVVALLVVSPESSNAFSILDTLGKVKDKAVSLVRKDVPQTVAVLPVLGNGTQEDKRLLRETFNNHISSKKFLNIKLEDVDVRIAELEKETGKKWYQLDYKTLGRKLGVDGLFVLELLQVQKIYAAVFASLSIKVRVSFIRVKDGKVIWRKTESVAKRSGGLPTSPWSAISTAISSALVLRESVKIALMDELCRKLASEIPEPPKAVVRKPPAIFAVITNAKDSPFGIGKEVLVAVRAKEGCLAYMEIKGINAKIKLLESSPGYYLGKYVVSEGDSLKNGHIRITLFDPETRLENEYVVQYPVEIDGIPPAPVSGLRVSNTGKGLHLAWNRVEDAVEYVVERNLGSKFVQLGVTQIPEFYDGNVTEGVSYYYRIYSKDRAGNLSKPVVKKVTYVKPGPTFLPANLVGVVNLYAAGSPYVVNGTVTVVKGARVVIEGGTVVSFEPGSLLLIRGKLLAEGEGDRTVFRGEGYRIRVEDAGEDALVLRDALLEGGRAVEIVNSGASFENVISRGFEDGVVLEGGGLLEADGFLIENAKRGVVLKGGALSGKVWIKKSDCALWYESGSLSEAEVKFGSNRVYVNALSPLTLPEVEIEGDVEKRLQDFVAGLKNCSISLIKPLNLSSKQLKERLYENLKLSVIKALLTGNREGIETSVKLAFASFKENTFKDREFWAYVFNLLGRKQDAGLYLTALPQRQRDFLEKAFEGKGMVVMLKEVRVPRMMAAGGWELFAKRAKERAVYDYIESAVPKLTVKKRLIVEKEIMPSIDSYVPFVTFLGKREGDISSSYYFMVVLDRERLTKDLVYYNVMVPEKRDTKLALVLCLQGSVVDRVKVFLGDLRYSYITLPCREGASVADYLKSLKGSKVDLLLLFNSAVTKMKSKLGTNLFLYNAVINLAVVDVASGREIASCSGGGFTYHFNDAEGKKAALLNAFEKITDSLSAKLLMYERKKAEGKRVADKSEQ